MLTETKVSLLDTPFLDLGQALEAGADLVELSRSPQRASADICAVGLRPPVPRPSKVWALGLAYRGHIAEMNATADAEPFFFLKSPSALCASGDAIVIPPIAPTCVDYEGEVAFVIGRQATAISPAEAWEHVAGVTILNDVSARDVQNGSYRAGARPNTSMAKSFDTFCPLGPCISTLDEFPDRDNIHITTHVNDEPRQDDRTSGLVWPVAELVSFLSHRTTLMPGDIISTGTPAGVGAPNRRFLSPGIVVRVHVDGIGTLENRVIAG
jgi:2-keto-4-pentenoate hydratase/2-oxohepta-3-ene-1,7-dioic acid hydratase in catechol pathway